MPKKLKLTLKELKVNSFVTSLKDGDEAKLKGGDQTMCTCRPVCTYEPGCYSDDEMTCFAPCPTYPQTECVTCPSCEPTCMTFPPCIMTDVCTMYPPECP
jgi:hypothetical protein